jgi:cytochrome bd-type quinol oxidase subunit 2
MSETHTASEPTAQRHDAHEEGAVADAETMPGKQRRRLSPFSRHFLEMLGAMAAGMLVTGAIFLFVVGAKTWDEVTSQYPTQALLAMAAGMTIPMVAWMLHRGMGRRNTYEMAAAMILPVIPFLCLVWFNVTQSAECAAYCGVTIVAMLALMRYRRAEYSTHSMHAM